MTEEGTASRDESAWEWCVFLTPGLGGIIDGSEVWFGSDRLKAYEYRYKLYVAYKGRGYTRTQQTRPVWVIKKKVGRSGKVDTIWLWCWRVPRPSTETGTLDL